MSFDLILRIRKLLWIYFWLLICEGALRRWLLPQLSTPLIFVREPIAIYALWLALPTLLRSKWSNWIVFIFPFVFISTILTLIFAHGDFIIAYIGFRTYLIQIPLIFVFALVFTLSDVIEFAKKLLFLSIPVTILFVIQSNLPSSHILNVGPGGVGTSVFSGALDRFRPPAIFTFINQVAFFYTLSCAGFFTIAFSSHSFRFKTALLYLSAISLLVALPFSISRTLLLGYATVVAFTVLSLIISKQMIGRLIRYLLIGIALFSLSFSTPLVQNASTAYYVRLENASRTEAVRYGTEGQLGPLYRILMNFSRPFVNIDELPLLGHGIGIGTQAGSTILRNPNSSNLYYLLNNSKFTSTGFLVGESSWDSTIGEMGVLGYPIIFWRTLFVVYIFIQSCRCCRRGNIYPLILLGSVFHDFLWGLWGQASSLGFLVVAMGLTLASMNTSHPPALVSKR